MPTATTIVVARQDLSIPGGDPSYDPAALDTHAIEDRFFDLLRDSRPDVVVLDLTKANGNGVDTIRRIRRQSSVPILVVCERDAHSVRDYRSAGAADCIAAPVEIVALNQALQQIVRVAQPPAAPHRNGTTFAFAGMNFIPQHNLVTGPGSARAHLTTAECRLLAQLVARPWQVHTRLALAEALYGRHRPATDRAIDVVVNRLRNKLASIGEAARDLIKTEFRRGYRFVSDVSAEP